MEKFTISEVVEQAVQTEKLGYEFYTTMAARFREDEELRRLFETLALREQQHLKTFSELKEIITDEEPESWEEVSRYLKAVVQSEFFLGKNKSLPSLEHVKTVAEAIHFAIGFEKASSLYFQSLRNAVKDKEIVDEIVNEEESHIKWLNEFRRKIRTE